MSSKFTHFYIFFDELILIISIISIFHEQGDGGAPLVCPVGRPNENRYAQNGIVAWGIGCKESHPAVYANVPLVRSWIDEKMNLIGLGTQYYTQP